MKKQLCVLLGCVFILGATACGAEEEIQGAATATMEQNGAVVTMTFDAKGDVVTKITQESVIDLSAYTEEQIAVINENVATAEELYGDMEGIEYSCQESEGQMVEKIVIPTDEDTLKAAMEQGLLPVDNEDTTQLSLEATIDNLESAGWTVE